MTDSAEYFDLYHQGFARVAVAVPRCRVADPAFNAEQTLALLHTRADGIGIEVVVGDEVDAAGHMAAAAWLRPLAAVLAVHTASSAGAMVLKGTCTTDACLAARPTVRSSSCRRLAEGGASSVTGSFSRPARSR